MGESCGQTQLPKDLHLCSLHFSPDEPFWRPLLKKLIGVGGYKRRLKPNEVPTVFSHKTPKHLRQASQKCGEKRQRQETLDALLLGYKQPARPSQPLSVQHWT